MEKISLNSVFPDIDSNPYLKEMFKIINFRKQNKLSGKTYSEKHHIIPRYWFKHHNMEVLNCKQNLVDLSFSEHVIVHILLKEYHQSRQEIELMNAATRAIVLFGLKKELMQISKLNDLKLYLEKIEENRLDFIKLNKTYKNSKWITNGKVNKRLKMAEQIPNGFYLGKTTTNHKTKIAITNGIENLYIDKNKIDCLPEGFYIGSRFKSTKGKVATIDEDGKMKYFKIDEIPDGYKIGSSNKGKKFSDQHRKNISLSRIGKEPWNKGKSLLQETKNKISEKAKNRLKTNPLSQEARRKISLANSGSKNGHCQFKGKVIFINNGIEQKLFDKDKDIPKGWKKGMLPKPQREKGKFRWIHNLETLENKLIGINEPLPIGYAEKMSKRK